MNESEVAGLSNALATDSSLSVKNPRDGLNQKLSGKCELIEKLLLIILRHVSARD